MPRGEQYDNRAKNRKRFKKNLHIPIDYHIEYPSKPEILREHHQRQIAEGYISAEQVAQQADDCIEYYRRALDGIQSLLDEVQRIIAFLNVTPNYVVWSIGEPGPRTRKIPYYDGTNPNRYQRGLKHRIEYIPEKGFISADQLKQQAYDYADRICDVNSCEKRHFLVRRYLLSCIGIPDAIADPPASLPNPIWYGNKMVKRAPARESYILEYIEAHLANFSGEGIRLGNTIHWFDWQLYRNGQGPYPLDPVLDPYFHQDTVIPRKIPWDFKNPGKLPFDPPDDAADDDDIDGFLDALDKPIGNTNADPPPAKTT
ncbi:MAG: hypothetical protein OXP71_05805 [Candidatus Poribacteria bacterium]|nr:hypothetical protein [Candidatus Poribacteria bacterium]